MSVTENVARKNMTPIEEATAYANYFNYKVDKLGTDLFRGKPFKMPSFASKEAQKEYSDKIGVGVVTIRKRIRLLWLTEYVQNMLEAEAISLRTAELLVSLMNRHGVSPTLSAGDLLSGVHMYQTRTHATN